MSKIWILIILAILIILGGYLLGYRSGKLRAMRENKEDELTPKK